MSHSKKIQYLTASAILLSSIMSTPSFAKEIVLSGSVVCPATYFTRKGGKEIHDRVYGLRNYNSKSTVTITRIRAWDNDSTNNFDGVPVAPGFKSILLPNESARFNASHVLPIARLPNNIQQIRIDYALDKPGMALHVGFAHFTRKLDGYQTARNGGSCSNVPPGAR